MGLLISVAASGQAPRSGSYVLDQHTVNAGGQTATSASFVVDGSLAQSATVGETTSPSHIVQSGFWTGLSARRVLRVAGTGTGDGTVSGPGIACVLSAGAASGDCKETFLDGDTVHLVAVPDPSNQFDGWANCDAVSTTTVAGDTCKLTIDAGRTVVATFTLQGTIGDRLWRDVDGDGVQDAGEPGLNGVTVVLESAAGDTESAVTESAVTEGDGNFTFVDVPPGTYTVSIDTLTLPAGVVPTFDADGLATPHQAIVVLASGAELDAIDFGYQPQTNLSITKEDSRDPLPGGETLVYTLTVQNLGPGVATEVVGQDSLPTGTTLVATVGCGEDPVGVPSCSLGSLAVGASVSYTIEVSIDPAPPASITNVASVTALEVDLDLSNNSDSETTQLDADPPAVSRVGVDPPTADGELEACETVYGQPVERLLVVFDEPMYDPSGDSTPNDVTNPASWSLIAAGPDVELQTTLCGGPSGDDVAVPITAVVYDDQMNLAVLELGQALRPAIYRLIACGDGSSVLVDRGGTALDGDSDGTAGGDFTRRFRADPENRLGNGHFDCDLAGWTLTSDDPAEIVHDSPDLDGSADSGSAAIENLAGGTDFALEQCAEITGTAGLELEGWLRLQSEGVGVGFQLGCSFYAGASCTGTPSAPSVGSTLVGDTGGQWLGFSRVLTVPTGSLSALCKAELVDVVGAGFTAHLDQLRLVGSAIFTDGFESGDTSAWSQTTP